MFVRRLRVYTGLILAAQVVSHFINHSLGLLVLAAREIRRRVRRRRKFFYALAHPTAGSVTARGGQTILEALRGAGSVNYPRIDNHQYATRSNP